MWPFQLSSPRYTHQQTLSEKFYPTNFTHISGTHQRPPSTTGPTPTPMFQCPMSLCDQYRKNGTMRFVSVSRIDSWRAPTRRARLGSWRPHLPELGRGSTLYLLRRSAHSWIGKPYALESV